VGRGPLAGPVVAGAFCFFQKQNAPKDNEAIKIFKGVRDSKRLSEKQREKMYGILTGHPAIRWAIGMASEKIIDEINILEATKLAMKEALKNLKLRPDFLLLDGNFVLEDLSVSQQSVIRGDEKIFSCAAASIIAKVTRDRLMKNLHKKYPDYGFEKHKGYGTREHLRAIKESGPCEIHRLSFAPFR